MSVIPEAPKCDKERPMYCPILRERCIGMNCAMAVKRSHPLISPYIDYWECGLTNADESDHRQAKVLAMEKRER